MCSFPDCRSLFFSIVCPAVYILSIMRPVLADEIGRKTVIPREVREFLRKPEVFFKQSDHLDLCGAIAEGDVAGVERSLQAGTSANIKGEYGVTPLFWAYKSRQFDVFRLLLKAGADPNVPVLVPYEVNPRDFGFPCDRGDSVLYMAIRNQLSKQWIDELVKHVKPDRWVHPVSNGSILHAFFADPNRGTCRTSEVLRAICGLGPDLDHADRAGYTPIRLAVSCSDYGFACDLIRAGASVACYSEGDLQIIHFLALRYKTLAETPGSSDGSLSGFNPVMQKEWDELLGILREKGFSLTEALKDLERAENSGSKQRYMRQRRIRREDRFSCESGREFRESLEDDPYFEDPLGEIIPRDCMAAPVD
jgi:hypothetical protein